jgi:ADP-ribose pyrophosphatase YjhB (NUDIX family)
VTYKRAQLQWAHKAGLTQGTPAHNIPTGERVLGSAGMHARKLAERLMIAAIRATVRFLRGSFTAGCVCIVRDPQDRILLVKPRYRLAWGLPGGFMRRDEQPYQAISRELREEIGVDLTFNQPVGSYVQNHQRHIDYIFTIVLDIGQMSRVARSSAELSRLRWHDPANLPALQPEAIKALSCGAGRAVVPPAHG